MTPTMGDITDGEGKTHSSDRDKVEAFSRQHLIRETGHTQPPTIVESPTAMPLVNEEQLQEVERMLRGCQSGSSLGPDRISYRLLKAIRKTPLGVAVLEEISCTIPEGTYQRTPRAW